MLQCQFWPCYPVLNLIAFCSLLNILPMVSQEVVIHWMQQRQHSLLASNLLLRLRVATLLSSLVGLRCSTMDSTLLQFRATMRLLQAWVFSLNKAMAHQQHRLKCMHPQAWGLATGQGGNKEVSPNIKVRSLCNFWQLSAFHMLKKWGWSILHTGKFHRWNKPCRCLIFKSQPYLQSHVLLLCIFMILLGNKSHQQVWMPYAVVYCMFWRASLL